MAETIKIGGELESTATGNVVAAASAIKDKVKNKYQGEINAETDASLADRYTKAETYNKTELNNMITTPNQQYVSVTANSQTTAVTDVLPATGAANTVYRVGNWDSSQFDASVYSEYAWNGSSYVHLSTKTKIGEVFDISAYHATGGTLATYANLSAALDSNNGGGVPQSLQKGGMSVKYVQSSDNKYVQYRLMADEWSTTPSDWQGVDEEPVSGSHNLVESGGVHEKLLYSKNIIELTESSPYYVSSISGAYIPYGTITQNQYTDIYKIWLFRIPAGRCDIEILRSTSSAGTIIGLIDDVTDFVIGGSLSENIVVNPSSTYSFTKVFETEQLIVLVGRVEPYGTFNYYASINYIEETYIKEKVQELDSSVAGLSRDLQGIPEAVQNLSEDVDDVKDEIYTKTYTNLTTDSTYYVDSLNNAYLSTGVITRNEYTSNYSIYLFKLPAGSYRLKAKANTATRGVIIGLINNASDLAVGTTLSTILLTGASEAQELIQTFNNEVYLVLCGYSYGGINLFGTIEEIVVKSNIENLDERVTILESAELYLKLTIPDTIYAIVGTELNLWNDTVSLSVDKGVMSPMNYQIRWNCSKGLITDRCFRFTPKDADAGQQYPCTCYLYDMSNSLIVSKAFTIKVLAKNALQANKNIVYFGDSLGASSALKLYNNFNSASKFSGTIPSMLGTNGNEGSAKYEAVGGYGWVNYATAGATGYRVYVSGVTSVAKGAVYSDGYHNFEVYEVNLTDGIGNLLLLRYYMNPGILVMPNGTLTKVSGSGDSSIPYTGAFQESSNPLWNDQTEQLDITQYKSLVGLQSTDKIDAVSFQFGVNDSSLADNLPLLMSYIDSLYHCFVDDNVNCKFIIGLTTSSGNDVNGSGANYGASQDWMTYLDRVYRIRQFYLTLQNNQDYPNIRIAPIHLEVDRYYGYNFSTRQISQRYTETEQYHNNYVHPGDSGYGQIGDAYFASYIGFLTEQ